MSLADTFLLVMPHLQATGDSSFGKCELIYALQWTLNALISHSLRALSAPGSRGKCICVCVHMNPAVIT